MLVKDIEAGHQKTVTPLRGLATMVVLNDLQCRGTVAEDVSSQKELSALARRDDDSRSVSPSPVLASLGSPAPDTDFSVKPSGLVRTDQRKTAYGPVVSDRRIPQKVYASKKGRGGDNKRGSQSTLKEARVVGEPSSEKVPHQASELCVHKGDLGKLDTGNGCVELGQLVRSPSGIKEKVSGPVGPQEPSSLLA